LHEKPRALVGSTRFVTRISPTSYSVNKVTERAEIIMSDLLTERTPLVIAAEINTIRYQVSKILISGSIEIGRRLKEAKDLLPYGEWGKWLKESVNYSQRTADRLMQLWEEYGTKLLVSSESDSLSDSSLVTNLTYTQALILLGVPEEEREEFIAEHHVESMTNLELQQAVKERDQALLEKKDLQKDLDLKSSKLAQLTTQNQSLEHQVNDYKSKYTADQEKLTLKAKELEASREELPSASKIAELDQKLEDKETISAVKTAEAQFSIHRDNLIDACNELLKMLTALDRTDREVKEQYREKLSTLLDNLAKMVKVWPPLLRPILRLIRSSPRRVKSGGDRVMQRQLVRFVTVTNLTYTQVLIVSNKSIILINYQLEA